MTRRSARCARDRASPARLPAPPRPAAGLPESIQKLIDSSPAARTAFWGIQIVDLASGKTLLRTESRTTSSFPRRTPSSSPRAGPHPPGSGLHLSDARLRRRAAGRPGTHRGRPAPDRRRRSEPLGARHSLPDGPDHRQSAGRHRRPGRSDWSRAESAASMATSSATTPGTSGSRTPPAGRSTIRSPTTVRRSPRSPLPTTCSRCTLTPGARGRAWPRSPSIRRSEFYRIENRMRTVAAGGERRIHFQRIPGQPRRRCSGARFRCAIAGRIC